MQCKDEANCGTDKHGWFLRRPGTSELGHHTPIHGQTGTQILSWHISTAPRRNSEGRERRAARLILLCKTLGPCRSTVKTISNWSRSSCLPTPSMREKAGECRAFFHFFYFFLLISSYSKLFPLSEPPLSPHFHPGHARFRPAGPPSCKQMILPYAPSELYLQPVLSQLKKQLSQGAICQITNAMTKSTAATSSTEC